MQYANLILPLPLNSYFTYSVPVGIQQQLCVGQRVVVPFGKKKYYTGIVVNLHNNKPQNFEVKEIIGILDQTACINQYQLKLWQFISDYYLCSPGEVMNAALPAALKIESETRIYSNTEFCNYELLSDIENTILQVIQKQVEITINDLINKTNRSNVIGIVKNLFDKQAIFVEETLKQGFKAKKEVYVKLTPNFNNEETLVAFTDTLKKAKQQQNLMYNYIRVSQCFSSGLPTLEITRTELVKISETTTSVLKPLIEKGVFECYEKEVSRIEKAETPLQPIQLLSPEQQLAYQQINSAFINQNVVLLHGVTSSGKTEIYMQLINEQLQAGKQVLYLLPEIALTSQIINRLRLYFGNRVGVYHSKFNDNERVEIWNSLNRGAAGGYQVILGVRSSVFLPFSNLGLVIVDEEHEQTYKQFDPAPRYHARDTAIVLASMHNAKVLLGSATPSIDSYYNAQQGKYALVHLNTRFGNVKMPQFEIVNTRLATKNSNMHSHFSKVLLQHIENNLSAGQQIILFQNRRGFAPYIVCTNCGYIPQCKNCSVTLSYHKHLNQLVCHYCGYALHNYQKCSGCNSATIQTMGFGTEKIEDELAILFPLAKIARLDLDSTRNKHAHEEIIANFENKLVDILVGTQMITKGLDFDNVSLVGILNADALLFYPDFRAYERAFQLMQQVSGRAGRRSEMGLVVIQTTNPGHQIIQQLLKNNFEGMLTQQLTERADFKYPPYYRLIKLTIKHLNAPVCQQAANQLAQCLQAILGNRVIGPNKPVINRIQNYYLHTILIKFERQASAIKIKEIILNQINNLHQNVQFKACVVVADVDPA